MQIPKPVIRRLPVYLIRVQEMIQEGVEWISSHDMAEALGFTSSTVRQDLSYLSFSGISKRGYEAAKLEAALTDVLGGDEATHVIIIGAGNLGCAIAMNKEFSARGFEIRGIFDADDGLQGTTVGTMCVQGMHELRPFVKRQCIEIGIIAVPAQAAQEVADKLIKAGVQGLLNLACAHLVTPPDIPVVHARLSTSLQELKCEIQIANKLD